MNEFLKELKELLAKHNASIEFSVGEGSDTYGLHGEKMTATIGEKTVTLSDEWWVTSSDIEIKK